jgi:hypothetical protein
MAAWVDHLQTTAWSSHAVCPLAALVMRMRWGWGGVEKERESARAEREKFIDNEVTEEQVTEEEMTQVTEAEFTTRVYYTTTVHHSGTTPSPGHRRASPISGRGSVQQS